MAPPQEGQCRKDLSLEEVLFYYRSPGDDGEFRKKPYVPYTKKVWDARVHGEKAGLGLETSYFEMNHWPTRVETSVFYGSQEEMEQRYYPELEERLRERTGAAAVIVLGHVARDVAPAPEELLNSSLSSSREVENGAAEVRPANKINGAVNSAHNDFGLRPAHSTKERVADFLTPGSFRHCLGGFQTCPDPSQSRYLSQALAARNLTPELLKAPSTRLKIVNVWRLLDPVEGYARTPFAVCDARTIDAEQDTVDEPFPQYTSGAGGEVWPLVEGCYNLKSFWGPRQTWYYFPEMIKDEVLLMKTFDSADGLDLAGKPLKTQFHSAFDHPHAPANAPWRRSCEARCLLVFPDAYLGKEEGRSSAEADWPHHAAGSQNHGTPAIARL